MDKDKPRSQAPENLDGETVDYPQQMRLLRLAESLGLQGDTVERLRASLLPEPGSSPLRIQSDFSYRQAASAQVINPEPDLGKGVKTAQAGTRSSSDSHKGAGSLSIPVHELGLFDPKSFLQPDETHLDVMPAIERPSSGLTPDHYQKVDPLSLNIPAPEPKHLRNDQKRMSIPVSQAPAASSPAAYPLKVSSPEASPQPRPAPRLDLAMEAELKLRKKIEGEQSWTAFRAEAWQLYESFPRPDMAARLLELVFLYGSAAELEEVLGSLQRDTVEFYTLVDANIRIHLVIKLWQAKRRTILDGLLFRKDLSLRLLPLERLYCCWSLVATDEGAQAYKYFKRYDQEIWNAQKLYGAQIKQSESVLALALGRLALQADDEPTAIKLLESVSKHSEEFQPALDILLELRVERDANGLCAYGQKLQKELDWRGRLALLDSFLLRIQRYEAGAPKDRAALNELLKEPLKWFPETPEAWQGLAEVLLEYQQLEYLLPHILHIFQQRAVQFNKPAFDHALWSEVRKHDFGEEIRNWFWQSVALLHEFTWGLGQNEALLWESRRQYREAREHAGKELPLSWQQLHKGLLQWIAKTDRLDEAARQRLLVLTKLMGDTQEISEADICAYLGQVAHPTQEVMAALENLARERQQWGLESFILDRKAMMLHYTNQDLARLWHLGYRLKRHDQCWRVASLLRSRHVLHESLDRHWSICGEKKREFTVHELQSSHLKKIITSFDGYDRRLAEALVTIGPVIPELLSILNQHLVPLKKVRGLSEAEVEIHQVLEKMDCIAQPKRLLSSNPSGMWPSKPPFFASLLDTKWSLVFMALAQRLGIPTWDWQLSLLHHQIETIIPKMTRGAELPMSGKVGRWLRALSPQQRRAWYDLAQLAKRFTDEEAQVLMARLLAKIATAMLPDHPLALNSLEKMRAPLRLRWDLEHWIASEIYGEVRRSLGTVSLGQYPEDIFASHPLAPASQLPGT